MVKFYAQEVVVDMASERMHGRGYIENGDKIAANFLHKEFDKFKLKSFRSTYYQPFDIRVNTFPDYAEVKLNGKKLDAGDDYIFDGSSGSKTGDYDVVHFNASVLKKKKSMKEFKKAIYTDKVIIVDKKGLDYKDEEVKLWLNSFETNVFKAEAIVYVEDKLTADYASYKRNYAVIKLRRTVYKGTEKSIQINVKSELLRKYATQNVIGYVEGSVYPDSFLVFSAHYDHLGEMGKEITFPGANDNASGCAMLLSLAHYYSVAKNKPKYSICFMAFGAEEVGLLGSKFYTENPYFPLSKIKFLMNMDIMGTGDEGITAVNGKVFTKEFDALTKINTEKEYLPVIQARGKAAISDHYFFTEANVPSFFIYTMGGIQAYHDVYDKAETLPLTKFADVYKLLIDFTAELQK